MTKDEAKRLMGEAAAELRDVRLKINCLTTKAERYLRVLGQASSVIGDSIGKESAGDDVLPEASEWPSIEEIEALCSELDAARTRRHALTERMREWGVID